MRDDGSYQLAKRSAMTPHFRLPADFINTAICRRATGISRRSAAMLSATGRRDRSYRVYSAASGADDETRISRA